MIRLTMIFVVSMFALSCSGANQDSSSKNIKTNENTSVEAQIPEKIQMEEELTKHSEPTTKTTEESIQIESSSNPPKEKLTDTKTAVIEGVTEVGTKTIVIENKEVGTTPVVTQADHTVFDQQLQAYVSSTGVVNYSSWKSDMTKLNDYITHLGETEPSKNSSSAEKMAYWINLYNASTIKLILDNMPLKSIMDIDGGKPWNRKWIKVGTNTYSLNHIEHEILRPQFKDARVHFAVNCAAKSCPPIHNRAFTASNLNSTLDRLTRKFINNSTYNKISENRLELSNIFNWYKDDFGGLAEYINTYTEIELKSNAKISYIDYDWRLNGK